MPFRNGKNDYYGGQMKIAMIYKWARDPEAATVRSDGSVDWRGAKMVAGEDDPAALDAAKAIAEGSGADILGLTIGDGDASWVLARGVKETYSVSDAPNLMDQAMTGKILSSAVQKISGVDVIVIGDSQAYSAVAVALGGELNWPTVMGLSSARVEGNNIIATRHVGSEEQTITVSAPVVLGFVAESEEKSIPGMKEMLMARKRPVTSLTLADLNIAANERLESRGSRAPEVKHAQRFDGSPLDAATKLVETLRKEGVL